MQWRLARGTQYGLRESRGGVRDVDLLRLSCRYCICKKLVSTVDIATISSLKCGESSMCLESPSPKCKPRLSGPSIRRTIAGAVSAVDLRCNLRPTGAVILIKKTEDRGYQMMNKQ